VPMRSKACSCWLVDWASMAMVRRVPANRTWLGEGGFELGRLVHGDHNHFYGLSFSRRTVLKECDAGG
jgi:hypothetical protein